MDILRALFTSCAPKPLTVSLKVADRSYPIIFYTRDKNLRYSDIIRYLQRNQVLSDDAGRTLVLYCEGCHRQITYDRETHQKIPATCCGLRSLSLVGTKQKLLPGKIFIPISSFINHYY